MASIQSVVPTALAVTRTSQSALNLTKQCTIHHAMLGVLKKIQLERYVVLSTQSSNDYDSIQSCLG